MHCYRSSAKWPVGIDGQGMELAHRNHRTTSFHLKQMQWPNSHTPNPHSPLHSWPTDSTLPIHQKLAHFTLFRQLHHKKRSLLAVTLPLSASYYGFGKCVGDCEEWQSRPALLSQVSDRCCLVIFFSALLFANVCKCAVIANVRCSVFFSGQDLLSFVCFP